MATFDVLTNTRANSPSLTEVAAGVSEYVGLSFVEVSAMTVDAVAP